jgi:hypothetical protein
MKKIIFLISILITSYCYSSNLSFYVSTNGNDNNAGTITSPFKTLEKVKSKIIENSGNTLTFYFRGGIYRFSSMTELNTNLNNVTFTNYNGEIAIFSGSLPITKYTKSISVVMQNRLISNAAKPNVWYANLDENSIANLGIFRTRGYKKENIAHAELFINDEPMLLSSYPNINSYVLVQNESSNVNEFYFLNSRFTKWSNLDKIIVHGFWGANWSDMYYLLDSFNIATGLIRVKDKQDISSFKKNSRLRFYNIFEEIDIASEYYIDTTNKILYFWSSVKNPSKIELTYLETALIKFTSVSNFTIQNVIFEGSRANLIEISNSSNIKFTNCIFRNVGRRALNIVSSTNITIEKSKILNIGENGIQITTCGNRSTLTSAQILIKNNLFSNTGRWLQTYFSSGVDIMDSIGISIIHNEFYKMPHAAITIFASNDCILEYNKIHDVVQNSNDAAAFDTGQDWTARGNEIRYNLFYNFKNAIPNSFYVTDAVWSIYIDDLASGWYIHHNIIANSEKGLVIGGGRDNIIDKNIFMGMIKEAICVDSRGLNWRSNFYTTMCWYLGRVPYQSDLWKTKYPMLYNILNDEPMKPKRNVLSNNVTYQTGLNINYGDATAKNDLYYHEIGNQWGKFPGFYNYANADFRLRYNAIVLTLGFDSSWVSTIGIEK